MKQKPPTLKAALQLNTVGLQRCGDLGYGQAKILQRHKTMQRFTNYANELIQTDIIFLVIFRLQTAERQLGSG